MIATYPVLRRPLGELANKLLASSWELANLGPAAGVSACLVVHQPSVVTTVRGPYSAPSAGHVWLGLLLPF
jgi:hypothetical protein